MGSEKIKGELMAHVAQRDNVFFVFVKIEHLRNNGTEKYVWKKV